MTDPDHLTLYPGRGVRCPCGKPASVFARCAGCREVAARCGDPRCGDAARDARDHCRDPWLE